MSTTVRVRLVRQQLDANAFDDITPVTYEFGADGEYGYMQLVFAGELTTAQVEAVTNRCESVNANGEELRRRARGAVSTVRTGAVTAGRAGSVSGRRAGGASIGSTSGGAELP